MAFRPPIARSLALSAVGFRLILAYCSANIVPKAEEFEMSYDINRLFVGNVFLDRWGAPF